MAAPEITAISVAVPAGPSPVAACGASEVRSVRVAEKRTCGSLAGVDDARDRAITAAARGQRGLGANPVGADVFGLVLGPSVAGPSPVAAAELAAIAAEVAAIDVAPIPGPPPIAAVPGASEIRSARVSEERTCGSPDGVDDTRERAVTAAQGQRGIGADLVEADALG
jgi:hypothetical protein